MSNLSAASRRRDSSGPGGVTVGRGISRSQAKDGAADATTRTHRHMAILVKDGWPCD